MGLDQKRRSISIDGRKKGVSIELAFWESLKEIARARGQSVPAIVKEIDMTRTRPNLSSAVRIFVLEHYRASAFFVPR